MTIQRSGMITLCGRPNVGKSTLANALAGEKIAIVSDKPQTTRNRITAVVNRGTSQFVFLDTPGLHKPRNKLGEYMVDVVKNSVAGVDGVCLLVEPIPNVGKPEAELISRIKALGAPAALVINKLDTVKKEELLAVMAAYGEAYEWDAVVPIAAKTGEGVQELLDVLENWLPDGPALFPEDMTTDQPERQVMSEILREKLDSGVIDVHATIYCEKESHKGIIIGKGGAALKKISSQAREDMERFMGEKVYLETWVKVKENWRDNPAAIQNFGYTEE